MENQFTILEGNNLDTLKTLPDNSVDSVVTDPPYGLSFMNKKWDYDVPSVELWREVYRVLKPGGHLLSFGGTRTYHRMVVNIEDAGFEIRDQIMWLYGSGFPKSLNIGKAIDKVEGNEREIVGENPNNKNKGKNGHKSDVFGGSIGQLSMIDKGHSEGEGWGTGLKPANEPICVARKPISENTIAENFIKWGVGGFNIDECRVEGIIQSVPQPKLSVKKAEIYNFATGEGRNGEMSRNEGRFPANIILECICDEVIKGEKGEPRYGRKGGTNESEFSKAISPNPEYVGKWHNDKGDIHTNPECPCRLLDDQSGQIKSTKFNNTLPNLSNNIFNGGNNGNGVTDIVKERGYSDNGGASRFFYVAKTSKAERNMGLDNFEDKIAGSMDANINGVMQLGGASLKGEHKEIEPKKNHHPTIKPVNLMSYLCKLVTPNGGVILDPYMGSGSTGIAALLGDYKFIGCEFEPEYCRIAEARISQYDKYRKFLKK